jgi:hypothetical protein
VFVLLILQIVLLFFKPHNRRKINFFILGMLAFSTLRPNILGESFGIIGPLYFILLAKLSKTFSAEYVPTSAHVARARNALVVIFIVTSFYWTYISLVSAAKGYPFSAWPPIANLVTIGIDCYLILQIFKAGQAVKLLKVFIIFVAFQAFSALISKYIFDYQYCYKAMVGRGWNYSFCAPGVVFSSSNRLTGFAGEPSIFSAYLSLAIVSVWWPQLKFRFGSAIFITAVCTWASFISNATTGVILVFVALALAPIQRFQIKNGPFYLILYSTLVYYLASRDIVQSAINRIFAQKAESNVLSLTDRSINFSFEDYLSRWETSPYGDLWGIDGSVYAKSINGLAQSLMYGPLVIFLLIFLIISVAFFSYNQVSTMSYGVLIFTTCLFLQPPWLNSIWTILIYIGSLSHVSVNSNARKLDVFEVKKLE